MTTQIYAHRTDPTPCFSPMDARKEGMIGYIRRKYNVPGGREIVIKQGFITDDLTPSPREQYDEQFIIKRKLSSEATGAVEKMCELIDRCDCSKKPYQPETQ